MTYIENIFVCMAAPLLLAALCMGRRYTLVFSMVFAGMGVCLLAAYINTFLAAAYGAGAIQATVEIAPVVEEIMKLLPPLFYLLVANPPAHKIRGSVLVVAAGFATFENTCYLIQNGASRLDFLLVRGFGAGAMHIVCGAIVGYGLAYVWPRLWLKVAGTTGLLCMAIALHGIYNLLVSSGGAWQYMAYCLPIGILAAAQIFRKLAGKNIKLFQ